MSHKPINVLILSNVAAIVRAASIKTLDKINNTANVTELPSQTFITDPIVASGVLNGLYGVKPAPKVEPEPEATPDPETEETTEEDKGEDNAQ